MFLEAFDHFSQPCGFTSSDSQQSWKCCLIFPLFYSLLWLLSANILSNHFVFTSLTLETLPCHWALVLLSTYSGNWIPLRVIFSFSTSCSKFDPFTFLSPESFPSCCSIFIPLFYLWQRVPVWYEQWLQPILDSHRHLEFTATRSKEIMWGFRCLWAPNSKAVHAADLYEILT